MLAIPWSVAAAVGHPLPWPFVPFVLAGLGYEAALQNGTREVASALSVGRTGPFWIFPIPFVISLMHFWYDGFVWSVQRKEV